MIPQHALEAAVNEFQRVIDAPPLTDTQLFDPPPCSSFTVDQLGEPDALSAERSADPCPPPVVA